MENEAPLIEEAQTQASAAVIWLHGLGADGYDFSPIVPQLGSIRSHTRFVFPHAPMIPVTLNQGFVMRAWYDLTVHEGEIVSNDAGIRESRVLLETLIEAEHTLGIPYRRIVIAGFSQGGAIAQHTALRFPQRLAGLMALSTYLPFAEQIAAERHDANADIPIFMAHGLDDPMIEISRAEDSRSKLVEMGYQLEWHTYPMGHGVLPAEIADIDAWLARTIPA